MKEFIEGDIYRINYTKKMMEKIFDPKHCFEGLGIVVKANRGNLVLADTFWGIGKSNGKIFNKEDVGTIIDIKFIINMNDLEPIQDYDTDYYSDEDLFILTEQHGCVPSCVYYYKRKGCVRSADKMRSSILKEISNNESTIEFSKSNIRTLKEQLSKLETGNIDDIFIV